MKREGYIYMLTNRYKNVLYIGVTSDLKKRIYEHKNHIYKNSFTDRYNLEYLVYYEGFDNIEEAITREKTIKKWNVIRKTRLLMLLIRIGKIYTMRCGMMFIHCCIEQVLSPSFRSAAEKSPKICCKTSSMEGISPIVEMTWSKNIPSCQVFVRHFDPDEGGGEIS